MSGADESQPEVSVVIPSVGRPELAGAIASAMDQTFAPLEVIVVFDLERIPPLELPRDPRLRTLVTGASTGGNGARDLGVREARGTLVAFLDDDDRWERSKLARQVDAYLDGRRHGVDLIVATTAQVVDDAGRLLDILPRRPPSPGQSVADYLFRRRSVAYGESMLCASMLLCSRALLEAVPLDRALRLHEDWDWLMRATQRPGVELHMVAEPLLVYRRQAEGGSVSRSGRWRESAAWFEVQRAHLSRREYGDALLTTTVPLALGAGDRRAALSITGCALRRGRPGPPAVLFALMMLTLPPGRLARISRAVRRPRRR